MAITLKNGKRKREAGFTLLIAAIFMSVMLTFGVALSSIGYKQQVLASLAIESQYAFYAANAALECALYADRQQGLFTSDTPPASAPLMSCDGSSANYISTFPNGMVSSAPERWVMEERFSLDAGKHCADVVIYKSPPGGEQTYVFSQGYNVPCGTVESPNGARFVSRGLSTHY